MEDQIKPPHIIQSLPKFVTTENARFGPIDLLDYIRSPNSESGDLKFEASLANGDGLPTGIMCTSDGFITGIPPKGSAGVYEISLNVRNRSETPLVVPLILTIKERLSADPDSDIDNLKKQIWAALGDNLPLPDLAGLLDRPITDIEIYYLLQRFAILTIWDVYNLETAGDKVPLNLPGCSPHYYIYDRGSCLVAAPKDLYSYERTLEDALQTSRVMAQEVYKRGWTIEITGFTKMSRAAWVELQLLAQKHGKALEILHYSPSEKDKKLFEIKQSSIQRPGPSV